MKNCDKCKNCVLWDYGYSNYTVEGTTFYCAKNIHPDKSFDHFYGEEPKLLYAEQCSEYEEGQGISLSVEDSYDDLTDEEKLRLKDHPDLGTF